MHQSGALILTGGPFSSPVAQGGNHRSERTALIGKHVFEPVGSDLVLPPLENARIDKPLQAGSEHIIRNSGGLELVEPTCAEQGIPHDQQSPPFPDQVEGAGDGTGELGETGAAHHNHSKSLA
jgi:hypothetical protein